MSRRACAADFTRNRRASPRNRPLAHPALWCGCHVDRQTGAAAALHLHRAGDADRADRRVRDPAHADRHLSQHQHSGRRASSGATPACRPRRWPTASCCNAERSAQTTVNDVEHTESQIAAPASRWSSTSSSRTSTRSCRSRRSPPSRRRSCAARRRAPRRRSSWRTTPPSVPILQLALSSAEPVGGAALRPRQQHHPHRAGDGAGRLDALSLRRQAAPGAGRPRPAGAARQGALGQRRHQCHRRAEPDPAGRHAEDRRPSNTSSSSTPARAPSASSTTCRSRNRNGTVVYVRDVAHVRDGYSPQTNIVRRRRARRAVLMSVLKTGSASTLDIINSIKRAAARIRAPAAARL